SDQAAAAVEILAMSAQVFSEVSDPLSEQGDLYFRRTGITFVRAEVTDHAVFVEFCFCHGCYYDFPGAEGNGLVNPSVNPAPCQVYRFNPAWRGSWGSDGGRHASQREVGHSGCNAGWFKQNV